ncbi:MAG: hypothetical protein K2N44_05935 [Lachnospiraceae bacterium]|nr:hypothetical protein [Lachnospiraceae bacterium]
MKNLVNNLTLRKKFLCTALTATLSISNCAIGTVYAASDEAQQKKLQTENTQTDEIPTESKLTDEELAAYYGDSVFIGDSIMVGFRNYSAKQQTFVQDIQFLAVGSYSAFNAMKPVTADNVHPMYKGKKCQVWNAVPLIGSRRAFILLGMNDISILGLEGARDKYKELIDKILETSPDIEIHIISVTYTLADQGIGKLNNENLAQYNILLQEMAEENGWEYIDLCTPISDGKGNLAAEYCSDGFVHLSSSAYTLWESELIDYANAQAAQEEAETESETSKDTQSKIETILEANPSQNTKGRIQ